MGLGCTLDSGEKCAELNQCLCNGRIKYKSKTACAITKACDEAQADYSRAQRRIQELMGQEMSSISGCESAILGTVCAYHFPRCDDDSTEYEDICLSTCQHMYDTCVPEGVDPCPPGSNWTEVDERGEPYRDANGNIRTTACPGTVGFRRFDALFDFLWGSSDRRFQLLPAAGATKHQHNSTNSSSASSTLRGVVAGRYYEHEPGKIKLSDFATVGSKCRMCLTPEEIDAGEQCTPESQQFTDANQDCTALSHRLAAPSCNILAMFTFLLVLAFTLEK